MDGQGELYQKDGSKYSGGFKNDLFEGYGILLYQDGTFYEGDFSKGKQDGVGFFKDVYMISPKKQQWKEGKVIREFGQVTFEDMSKHFTKEPIKSNSKNLAQPSKPMYQETSQSNFTYEQVSESASYV